MVYPINKEKEKLKELWLAYIQQVNFGAFISDGDIKSFVSKNKLNIPFKEVMAVIRVLEEKIGIQYKKRLKRLRNEGYLILEPRLQVDTALREGKIKVQAALKKTSRRLDAVDVSNFTSEQQRELMMRTASIDSILNIVQNSSLNKKIVNKKIVNKNEVDLLEETAYRSKKLKQQQQQDDNF